MKFATLAVLGAVALPAAAQAQDDSLCRNGFFPREAPFSLARVNVDRRVYFHSDMGGCPAAGDTCATNAYLVGDDEVIVGKLRDGFACAYYPPSDTAGWIWLDRIEFVPAAQEPDPDDWAGHWQGRGDNTLTITHLGHARLRIEGLAFWPARQPPEGYSVHVGELVGRLDHLGTRARFDDSGCEVNFTLLDDYLLAGDNNGCGGANVSFTGVYTRQGD